MDDALNIKKTALKIIGFLLSIVFIAIVIFVLFLNVLFYGWDEVTTEYKTYNEARGEYNYFCNGWLPDIFPKSISNIVTNNNLDINTSYGSFDFEKKSWQEIQKKIHKVSIYETIVESRKEYVKDQIDSGFDVYRYSESEDLWLFYCKPSMGYCEYEMSSFD